MRHACRWVWLGLVGALFVGMPATAFSTAAPAPAKQVFDYVYVVDTSGSMIGKGDGKNAVIMPKVKAAIVDQIMGLEGGATVVVMPFNQGVKATKVFKLLDASDRKAAVRYVEGLKATGSSTWIYRSMLDALAETERLAKSSDRHVQTILLFTDGLDNEPGRKHSFDQVAREFSLQRGEGDNLWLKYLTLGVSPPKRDKSIVDSTDGMELLVSPRGKVIPLYNVEVRPYRLDFGNLRRTQEGSVTVRFSFSDKAKGLPYQVDAVSDELLALGVNPVLEPATGKLTEKLALRLTLENAQSIMEADDEEYSGVMSLRSSAGLQFAPPEIPFSFRIRNEPVVSIAPQDAGNAKSALGRVSRTRNSVEPTTRKWLVRWTYADPNSAVTLRVWPSEKNPADLGKQGAVLRTSSGEKGESVRLSPEDQWVTLSIAPQADAPAGAYEVGVMAAAERAELQFTGAKPSADNPGELEVPTAFELAKRPLSVLTVAAIIAAAVAAMLSIAFVGFCLFTGQGPARAWRDLLMTAGVTKPKFGAEDQCVVREPREMTGRTASLYGLSKLGIGQGGEFLDDAGAAVRIETFWANHRLRARAVALEGDVRHREAGVGFDSPFAEVELGHGDLVKVGQYHVQFESGTISHS